MPKLSITPVERNLTDKDPLDVSVESSVFESDHRVQHIQQLQWGERQCPLQWVGLLVNLRHLA